MSAETGARAARTSGAVVALAAAAASAVVLVVQLANLGELLDVNQGLTAGFAKALLAGYVLAVIGIGAFTAFAPRRLLWLPVAMAALLALAALLATLTVGTELWSFAMAVMTMAACWRAGNWLLERLGAPELAAIVPAAWLAGTVSLGLVILAAGRAGALRWWTVAVPVVALGLTAVPPAARALRAVAARPPELTRAGAAAASVMALLLAVASVFTAAPELMYDALYAKAWVPSEWARTGSIDGMPMHPVLNNLGFAQVLAVPGHLAGAEGVGRYLQLLAAASVPAAVWWVARRSAWAPIAALAVAVTPHLFWQATTAYDDALLVLAVVGLAAAVVRLMEAAPASPFACAVALGVLAGACVDLKLHLGALAAGLVGGWLVLGAGPGRVRAALGAGLGALVTVAPPYALRWIDLDNPLLPAFNNVFKSDLWPHIHDTLNLPFFKDSDPIEVVRRSITDPGALNEAAPAGAFGLTAVAVFAAMAVLWSRGRRDRTALLLWAAVVVGALGWYQQFRYLRYLLPIGTVAILAFALAGSPRPLGALTQRAAIAAACVIAALLWPATIAQFWNVPGKDLPWEVALHTRDDYEYERTSMVERDALAAYDRAAPPGALAVTVLHQRIWLSEGRDLTPNWEMNSRLDSNSGGPRSAPLIDRMRRLGAEWIITGEGRDKFGYAGADAMLGRHGEVAFSDQGWVVYRLVDRPRAPEPMPCDDRLTGRPGCWAGSLDSRAGYALAESPGGITRPAAVCPGKTLVADIESSGSGPGLDVTVAYDDPDPGRGHVRHVLPSGKPARVYATAPSGAKAATVSILGADGVVVERVRLGTLGECSGA